MAGEKFFLNFVSDGFGIVQIDEPFGFSSLKFDIQQKEGKYARDIFFSGGEGLLEFGSRRNHYFDKLLYYFHYKGFEADVKIIIQFPNGENVIMDLDFYSAVTDDLEYFRCKCIEVSDIQIVKRRSTVKVDLFSNKDIDGNNITPVQAQNILLKPKAISQTSKWDQVAYNNVLMRAQGAQTTNWDYVNPCANIKQSDIQDTLSWFEINANAPDDFYLIQAQNNLININIKIEGLKLHFSTDVDNGGNGYVDMALIFKYGADINSATSQTLFSAYKEEGQTFDYDSAIQGNFNLNIPALNRGDKIWIYFAFKIRQSASIPAARFEVFTTITGMTTTITAVSKSYYSTTKGIRLIDAVKQVIKSISKKDLLAPILDVGSQYYSTFLFNGNLLRGIINKPFYLSLEDLEKSLSSEINGDFETDDQVFFGLEKDFYSPTEIWFFDNTQFSGFDKKVNEKIAINEFSYNYTNFQSQKENEITNSGEIIHGRSTMTLFNKMVENKKEISIDWVRDAFMIEETKRKSLEISDDTASQDSDNIFAIDTIENLIDTTLTEITLLYHEYNESSGNLFLRTKTEPNFLTLGLGIGNRFDILPTDKNSGSYKIISLSQNAIELKPHFYFTGGILGNGIFMMMGQPNSSNNGERLTSYRYTLDHITYPFTNRTDQGISNISNLNSPDTFSNLRYSVRRNIENNYSGYLAAANIYWKKNPIKVTFYQNNRDFTCTYNGLTTKEGSDYYPENPLLSSWIYENAIFANVDLEDVFAIRNYLKAYHGFIRCIDKTGNVIKIFPQKISYDSLSKELNITGEGKFEPIQMLIETNNDGFIKINKETSIITDNFIWELVDHKLSVFDNHRQRLYNPVFWDKVSINGGFAKSEQELKELLNLL